MSMKIKTIMRRIDNADNFDAAVNEALEDGWHLVKRDVVTPMQPHMETRFFHAMLYAELAKMPEAELQADPVTWQDAMRVIRAECDLHESCLDCPATDACNHYPPNGWEMGLLEETND